VNELKLLKKDITGVLVISDGPSSTVMFKYGGQTEPRALSHENPPPNFCTIIYLKLITAHYHFVSAREFPMNEYRLLIMDLRLLTFCTNTTY